LAAEFDGIGGWQAAWTLVVALFGGASPTLEKMSVDLFPFWIHVE
jgi:hypothetical protein